MVVREEVKYRKRSYNTVMKTYRRVSMTATDVISAGARESEVIMV
jgi:hypothetical protein